MLALHDYEEDITPIVRVWNLASDVGHLANDIPEGSRPGIVGNPWVSNQTEH